MKTDINFNILMSKCRDNNRVYQEVLYTKYYATVYKICMRYASNNSEGLDFMQEIFIKTFNKINTNTFKGDSYAEMGAWISRVATNYCIDQYRKFKRRKESKLLDIPYNNIINITDDMEEEVEFTTSDAINAIHKLSPRYRTIFNMFVMEGFTHKEISDELSISVGASKSSLHKAKSNLRNILEK